MENNFDTQLSNKELENLVKKAHTFEDLSDNEMLEFYKYLSRKIEKMNAAFKKNLNGVLSEEELNEVLSY